MISNQTIIQKADLALAELTTDAGVLQPAQAQKFMKLLIKESRIMQDCTVVPMKAPKQLIEKMKFGERILRPGAEGTALAAADRAKPTLSKVELDAQLFKAEVRLTNEVLEDSIERGGLRQTIMTMMAERISTDMEEIVIQGDTASTDPTLAVLNGILKQATSNVVAAGGVKLTKSVLKDVLKTMPTEYKRNKAMLRYYASTNAEVDYRDSLGDRATALGDSSTEKEMPVFYSGTRVVPVELMPENEGVGSNESSLLFCDPKNIQIGMWRQIRVETDKLVSEGVMLVVATIRFDVKFAHEPAVTKATGITID